MRKVIRLVVVLLVIIVAFPAWLLFSAAVNMIGLRWIRNQGKELQTPVVTYSHPRSGRRVVLVGTIHIAEPEYFARLRRFIDSFVGCRVLFESVVRMTKEEESTLSPDEMVVANDLKQLFGAVRRVCEVMELQYQREGLPPQPGWINTDMRAREIIKLLAEENVRLRPKKKLLQLQRESGKATIRWFFNKMLKNAAPHFLLFSLLKPFTRKGRVLNRIIVKMRDRIACEAIEEYLRYGDVIAIWGAGHLPGISRWLRRAGFQETDRTWFTAYHARHYDLSPAVDEEGPEVVSAGVQE